ncbi:hypothetical protein MWU52_16135 [Jannaschia sp. S6380]|uniref:hypothetical protein n=1 Tax=Jannaschia sp. S6380 TaxID=2926408 RepID=UPI001FF3A331|nr:hypothetical protein [Jannaschia sp. S6380]MCK0169085.1 hypothetical protein [Jannaschia sp. S6380]
MDLIAPLVGLAVLAWLVPWALGRLLPEGLGWLFAIGAISAVVLAIVAGVGFFLLYGAAGGVVLAERPWHFVLLSARASLIWLPVMVLSLANLPRGWKKAEW